MLNEDVVLRALETEVEQAHSAIREMLRQTTEDIARDATRRQPYVGPAHSAKVAAAALTQAVQRLESARAELGRLKAMRAARVPKETRNA